MKQAFKTSESKRCMNSWIDMYTPMVSKLLESPIIKSFIVFLCITSFLFLNLIFTFIGTRGNFSYTNFYSYLLSIWRFSSVKEMNHQKCKGFLPLFDSFIQKQKQTLNESRNFIKIGTESLFLFKKDKWKNKKEIFQQLHEQKWQNHFTELKLSSLNWNFGIVWYANANFSFLVYSVVVAVFSWYFLNLSNLGIKWNSA